jgi:citrate lyase subunit beta/citryl-CoA lyase
MLLPLEPLIPETAMVIRSLLYAPGNEPRKLTRVGTFGADGVILDLEDSVPVEQKVAARATVREAVSRAGTEGARVYVRVNPAGRKTSFSVDHGAADIAAVVRPELDGLVLPKVESAEELNQIESVIAQAERENGIREGSLEVTPLIESAAGLWNAYEIARGSPRVRVLHFGAADFTRDLGIDWSRNETEVGYARSRLAVISRAAGIEPPIDSPWVRLDDDDGLAGSIAEARRLGFQGKLCIHPRQVEIVNRGFSSVSTEALAHARKVVEAFSEAESRGSASIVVDGQFIDYPMVEKARRTIEFHAMAEGE